MTELRCCYAAHISIRECKTQNCHTYLLRLAAQRRAERNGTTYERELDRLMAMELRPKEKE